MIFDINEIDGDTSYQFWGNKNDPVKNPSDELLPHGTPIQMMPDPRLQAGAEDIDKFQDAYKVDVNEELNTEPDHIITDKPFLAIKNFDANTSLPTAEGTMQGIDEPGKTLPQEMTPADPVFDTAKSQWYLEVPKAVTAIQYVGNNIEAMGDFCNNGRYRITQLENGALMLADSERNTVINPGDYVVSLKSGFSVYKADDFVKEFRYIERDSDAEITNEQVQVDNQQMPQEEVIQDQSMQQFANVLGMVGTGIKKGIDAGLNSNITAPFAAAKTFEKVKNTIRNRMNSSGANNKVFKFISAFGQDADVNHKHDLVSHALFSDSNDTILFGLNNEIFYMNKINNFDANNEDKRTAKEKIRDEVKEGLQPVMLETMNSVANGLGYKMGQIIGGAKHAIFGGGHKMAPVYFNNEEFEKNMNYSLMDHMTALVIKKHITEPCMDITTNKDFYEALDRDKGIDVYNNLQKDINDGLKGQLDLYDTNMNQTPTNLDKEGALQ